jgi:transcriptional regulator of met regulon
MTEQSQLNLLFIVNGEEYQRDVPASAKLTEVAIPDTGKMMPSDEELRNKAWDQIPTAGKDWIRGAKWLRDTHMKPLVEEIARLRERVKELEKAQDAELRNAAENAFGSMTDEEFEDFKRSQTP